MRLGVSVSNARLTEVIGRHLHLHLVTDRNADEIFSHLAGDMREHLVTVGKRDTEHRPRQDLGYRSRQFNWFFFSHEATMSCPGIYLKLPPKINFFPVWRANHFWLRFQARKSCKRLVTLFL